MLDAAAAIENENPTRRRMRALFNTLDADSSGYLGPDELGAALTRSGMDSHAVQDFVTAMDTSKDGQICVEEFLNGARLV